MVELAARDGRPPPSDLPRGGFICTSLADGGIRIDHADPRVLISGELLDTIARSGGTDPGPIRPALNAWLNTTGCAPPPWRATYVGAVLHLAGVNRTVIYRITGYIPEIHGYIAEWPD